MRTLAVGLVEGKADLADILFLIAFIAFVVATVLAVVRSGIEAIFVPLGLACVALAWFVL